MSLHKLTAGDGYMYLIRQVAAADATDRGRPSLADYYSAKGEAPGTWMGRGLVALGRPASRDADDPLVADLWGIADGSQVTEVQMKALFGEGLHPNADRITAHLTGLGVAQAGALGAARLGRPFLINDKEDPFITRLRGAYRDYNAALGQDAHAGIDAEIRARIRTALGRGMFAETYGRPPADERELSGFIARHSRAATTAVAGYDLTFSPVKSVSALWAIAPAGIAQVIEDCHHQAVAETLAFLEDNAAFSRMGAHGVAQVNTSGLIAAAFDHRDSRAGDPNLHTHLVISNKVRAVGADGIPRWLALDGTPLHHAAVAASEFYNTRNEALLIGKIGLQFTTTPTQLGKRPVREIVGIPAELIEKYSSRSADIDHRVGQLAKHFHTAHGREPTAVEMLALAQQATLETRKSKHQPRSLAEQRHVWRTQAIEVLGSRHALTTMLADVTHAPVPQRVTVTGTWVNEQAAQVIKTVAQNRATWNVNHVRAEAQRLLRYTNHPGGPEVATRIADTAISAHSIALTSRADTEMNEPAVLRRRDGVSVYTRHDTTLYTSAAIVAAERRILAAAALRDGRTADTTSIGLALLEYHANHGVALNEGQASLVKKMAVCGARVQLALAPAGTGKTTAMATLAAAWRNSGGTVIGLAPTAGAAEVLSKELGAPTDTIAKLVQLTNTGASLSAPTDDPARNWFDAIGFDTLLIVDEAAMAATFDLDTLIGLALTRGASVRLIGDDQQLASISAGGILRDLAERHDTVTLSTVVRFTHPETGPTEALASLALRAGDPAAIGFYIDHHRIHVGADTVAADMAYQAWAADHATGRDSILLAPTNELVAELNQRARLDRLAHTITTPSAVTVTLADGSTASAGDWITTRKNARWLATANGRWVKNGHRWIIGAVHHDGSITVTPLHGRATAVRLPAHYVTVHTTLGYASTINAAQGMTAGRRGIEGSCHIVGSDRLTRQQLYVALTRGSTENHLYFSTAEADPHRILAPKATHPPTAVDILSAILARDGAQLSAHSAATADADPFNRLHRATAMYADALTAAAEQHAGPTTMSRIDTTATTTIDAHLTDTQAWPVLRRNLALLAVAGHDPIHALHTAAHAPLDNAQDPAAVLDWRLPAPPGSAEKIGPLRWLPATPDVLSAHPHWGPYLQARAQLVTDLADQIRATAHTWEHSNAPAWARPLLHQRPELMAEIAVFRAAHNVDPADTRPTGPQQHANRSAALQHLINTRLGAHLTDASNHTQRWRQLADQLNSHLTTDPFWPRLAAHLDNAARAGADVTALLNDAISRHSPLPAEMPAAALWWRLAGTLTPPALDHPDTTLRPSWTTELHHLLGTRIAETVITDPAWPALVAAVAGSDWLPHQLLCAATEHLHDIAAIEPLHPDEYAHLLTYRVQLLTHHAATINVGIDDLNEPPPDRYDYPYGLAEDDLTGLDFADLLQHRPPTAQGRDIDIPGLRARRDAAHQHARQLQHAIMGGSGGPAEQAAAGELAELHHRHQQQRPYQYALAHAHTQWVHAEDTAELHHQLLNQLTATITATRHHSDHQAAACHQECRDQIAQQTNRIDSAVRTARTHLDAARAALIEFAGSPGNIITEHHIQNRRTAALRADTQALTDARNQSRDLDNQLARAETLAAHAWAQNPVYNYDLATAIPQLRAEIDLLAAANATSPAAIHHPSQTALHNLDEPHHRAVTAIATDTHTVQLLHLHPGADKPATLAALATTAHHHHTRVLALPATPAAVDYAAHNRYADTTVSPEQARTNLENQRWKLPRASLIVVDDANHLHPQQLHWLIETATTANTKLILITTGHHQPAHTLTTTLETHLPWAQHLGTPHPGHQRPHTTIEQVSNHLSIAQPTNRPEYRMARELLHQHNQLLDHFHEIANTTAQLDAIAIRSHDRNHGHDYGLEI